MSVKDFVFYSIDITPSGIVASIVASSCVGENANVLRMHFPLHLHTRKTNMMRFQFYALKWPSVYRKRAITTRGLYTFYSLFEFHLCSMTFVLEYG